ncbi:MAG: DinB family protein [Chloroflexi bacterium]|nr:DinB family protein [Chloroflexota bacterium]
MADSRIPDPTLMARLQLSVKGVDWAAARVRTFQHRQLPGEWSAHQHVFHLLATERQNYQPRIRDVIAEERPVLMRWDGQGYMDEHYTPDADITVLAEEFVAERATTYELFKALTPEQWRRTGTWPDGREVDLAWIAEKALWHALDHFAFLLALHGEFEPRQAAD